MIERQYTIHNIVNFTIKSKTIPKRMSIEYVNFETNRISRPDFTINIGDFIPSNDDCSLIDHTFYIKEDYFYCKDSYKFGTWEVEVTGLESDTTTIKLSTNSIGTLFPDMFICAYIIDFFIRFKLERKGYSVIHASSMCKNNHAYVFPSQSGAGKTTTALYLAEKGYNSLGDDFVILYQGQVFSYPTPLNIFSYNLNPVIQRNLPIRERVILKLKTALYTFTAGKIKIFTKLNPRDVPDLTIVDASPLKSIYLLAQGDRLEITDAKPVQIMNSLIINQKLESYPFLKYLLEYSYVFPNSSIARFWDTCERNLKENIKGNVNFYSVRLPRQYTREVFNQFQEVIECGN